LAPTDVILAEEFFSNLHRSLAVRLHQIDALGTIGDTKEAAARAAQLAQEVKKLRDSEDIKDLVSGFTSKVNASKATKAVRQKQVEALQRLSGTLEPGGSIHWVGQAAAVRAELLKSKE
jgi:hypothetical protein